MRVAVILTGVPRFTTESSFWLKNRQFSSQLFNEIKFDYFIYFWDNVTDNAWPGNNRIYNVKSDDFKELYNAKSSSLLNFDNIMNEFSSDIMQYHKSDPERKINFLKNNKKLYNSFLFQSEDFHDVNIGKGAWGQFLAINYANKFFDSYYSDYDIIIKTRSDAILDNISEDIWLRLFSNISNATGGRYMREDNIIYTNLLRNVSGYYFIDDKFLISTPRAWRNYCINSRESFLKLATTDCLALYDLTFDQHKSCDWEIALWHKLSYYNNTSFKSIYQTFNVDIGDVVLIRKNYDTTEMNYNKIRDDYYNFYSSNVRS